MTELAERYTKAVYSLADQQGIVDTAEKDLKFILDIFKVNAEIYKAIINPIVKKEEKKSVVKEVFGIRINGMILSFLFLLIDHKRFELIEDVIGNFHRLVEKAQGITDVEFVSAMPVNKNEEAEYTKRLSSILNKKVRLNVKVSKFLLAGIQIRIGSRMIDGSSRGHLERLRMELMKT